MKPGTETNLDKKNKMLSKTFGDDDILASCGVIVIFLIYWN